MSNWIDVVCQVWQRPRARNIARLLGLLVLLKLVTYGWGAKLIGTALICIILWNFMSEWRGFLPAFQWQVTRRFMRLMKSLRPIHKIPPDIPVVYGVATTYIILRTVLMPQYWHAPLLTSPEDVVLGLTIAVASLRHARYILITVGKWSWSRMAGKAVYAVAATVCVALGHADATRATRLLTHTDAKYYVNFVGLLSSGYIALNVIRCIAIFVSMCAILLLLINLPNLFLRSVRGTFPTVQNRQYQRVVEFWRRIRYGRKGEPALLKGGMMRDIIELFTPCALLSVSVLILQIPEWISKSPTTEFLLSRTLVAMEYTADGGCPKVPANLPTVHLDGDYVSVATMEDRKLITVRQTCH